METVVGTLYERSREKYSVSLLGGENGLANSASWVYLAEDIGNVSFLRGGEFVLTTGLFVKADVTLRDFVEALALRDCSGVLVNIGPYLTEHDLTQDIRDFCDANSLPLFVMPWEIHLVDIMQELSAMLLQEQQRMTSLNAAFEAALYQTPVPEVVLQGLRHYGFEEHASYRVAVIHNLAIPAKVSSPLNRRRMRYHLFRHNNLHVLIHRIDQQSLSPDELVDLACYCDAVSMGVSGPVDGLHQLGTGYRRARFSLSMAELWQRPFVGFEEMGMLQLLFGVSDLSLLEDLCDHYLGPLEDYDQLHDTDLVHTLKVFLICDCNLVETALRLPAHRNTVVYRVRRIKEVLQLNIDQATVKFNLLLALYIREYLSM